MQVSCSHCAATYEFDSATIPASGYDAQCTQCNGVFFVGPPPTPQSSTEVINVTCNHCGATYQFSAAEVPEGGYDAQCTQCENVFFVGGYVSDFTPLLTSEYNMMQAKGKVGALGRPQEIPGTVVQADPDDTHVMPPKEPITDESTAEGPSPGMPLQEDSEPAKARSLPDTVLSEDPATLAAALSSSTPPYDDFDQNAFGPPPPEPDDMEAAPTSKRRLWYGILGGLALATLGLIVVRVVGSGGLDVNHTVEAAAVAKFEEGRTSMLEDTMEGYGSANKAFAQALKIDPKYPDAYAYSALAHAFRSADLMEQGQQAWAVLGSERAVLRGLQSEAAGGDTSVTDKTAQQQTHVQARLDEATDLFESGGKEMSQAWRMVQQGQRLGSRSPLAAVAAALCYGTEASGLDKATVWLAQADQWRTAKGAEHGSSATQADLWARFARATQDAADPQRYDKARTALTGIVGEDRHLLRARWELARIDLAQGKLVEARRVCKEILADAPNHEKARAALQQLIARDAKPAAVAASEPMASPKERGRPHRSRGRRQGGLRRSYR